MPRPIVHYPARKRQTTPPSGPQEYDYVREPYERHEGSRGVPVDDEEYIEKVEYDVSVNKPN